jgi:hypothetical protein
MSISGSDGSDFGAKFKGALRWDTKKVEIDEGI